jgi:hypothetical protein
LLSNGISGTQSHHGDIIGSFVSFRKITGVIVLALVCIASGLLIAHWQTPQK